MSMIISSLKRRNEALQNECDALAQGVDNLSVQLHEAYQLLQKHEPDYVRAKLNPEATASAPVMMPVEVTGAVGQPPQMQS